jgi:hypothetical protein
MQTSGRGIHSASPGPNLWPALGLSVQLVHQPQVEQLVPTAFQQSVTCSLVQPCSDLMLYPCLISSPRSPPSATTRLCCAVRIDKSLS